MAAQDTALPLDSDPGALRPGQYLWSADAVPQGPVVMAISLDRQLAFVYRNGVRIGVSTISSGRRGFETPTGVFTILQKQREHYSNLYDSAPMPFMQRLTWDGIALHAGHLPGYPASHGCVRLPPGFAERLFDITRTGMTVVVTDATGPEARFAPRGVLAPFAPGPAGPQPALVAADADQPLRWQPERASEGPVTVLVGLADRELWVLRNGIEIGRAWFRLEGEPPAGTHAFVRLDGAAGAPARWQAIALPGQGDAAVPWPRLNLPGDFRARIEALLVPGSTVVLTTEPVQAGQTGQALTVLATEPEAEPGADPPGPRPDPRP